MNDSNQLAEKFPEETRAVSMFERLARDPEVNVDKLDRLMQLQERMMVIQAKQQFDAAFSEMQADIPSITERGEIKVKDEVRSKYARFEDINDTLKPILQKHGFAVSFKVQVHDKHLVVTGILSHRAGHREETSLPLPFDESGGKPMVQAIGSSVSYGKRYTMCALLNITSRGEDDDGNQGKTAEELAAEAYKKCFTEHEATIKSIKANIDADNLDFAARNWFELPESAKDLLWRAPSKGGCWTTEQRRIMKTREFREAYYGPTDEPGAK